MLKYIDLIVRRLGKKNGLICEDVIIEICAFFGKRDYGKVYKVKIIGGKFHDDIHARGGSIKELKRNLVKSIKSSI